MKKYDDLVYEIMMNIEENVKEICKDNELDLFYEENNKKIDYIVFSVLARKIYKKGE